MTRESARSLRLGLLYASESHGVYSKLSRICDCVPPVALSPRISHRITTGPQTALYHSHFRPSVYTTAIDPHPGHSTKVHIKCRPVSSSPHALLTRHAPTPAPRLSVPGPTRRSAPPTPVSPLLQLWVIATSHVHKLQKPHRSAH